MTEPKTPEAMLAAVIEAQVKGGQSLYKFLRSEFNGFDGPFVLVKYHEIESFHILEILLDPEGVRAAYGEARTARLEGTYKPAGRTAEVTVSDDLPVFRLRAHQILNAWLSGGAEAAIFTAYDLLPEAAR